MQLHVIPSNMVYDTSDDDDDDIIWPLHRQITGCTCGEASCGWSYRVGYNDKLEGVMGTQKKKV